ncbi:MAG: FKBP-type peptidyl-prolyl cis-trans isomerase [Rikenellaceae bacterium]
MKKVTLTALVAAAALVCSCSGEQAGLITKGNKSKLDSLSYALGANVGYTVNYQMSDIPFDYDAIGVGLEEAAFENSSVTPEQAMQTLQEYFTNTRAMRAQIVEEKRQEADKAAFASGADSATVLAARAALKADADMFESEAQRHEVSYAFGVDLGTNIRNAEIPIQTYWVAEALKNIRDAKAVLSENAAMSYLQNYFTVVRPAELQAQSAAKLAEIEKKSGVKKTESGLLYRVEVEGDMTAAATKDEDTVKVNYTGRLLRNDNVFDTSRFADRPAEMQAAMQAQDPEGYNQDKPIEFPLNRVIPGWTEGMKLVGKGGRISLWIPAELAYGERGAGRDIGPNEALFFDVEVIDVIPAE